MGLWSYFKERSEYQNEVTRARETLAAILDLSYKVGHSCPEDVEAKLAIRCIGFEAINAPTPPLPKLRDAFDSIASRATEIVDRSSSPFDADVAALGIVVSCLNWQAGYPATRSKR